MKHRKRKDLLLLATELTKSMPHASNAKDYKQSFLKNKNKNCLNDQK